MESRSHLSKQRLDQFYLEGGWRARENAFWRAAHGIMMRRFAQVVARLGPGMRVLDVGCGEAEFSRFLAPANFVCGLDISEVALARARQHVPAVVVGDASGLHLPFKDGAFDATLLMGTLYYLPDPLACFRLVRRALKPSGYFVLSTAVATDPSHWRGWLSRKIAGRWREATAAPGQDWLYLTYTPGEVESLLREAGFRVEAWYPFLLGIPVLRGRERWLPLLAALGELYPMLAEFRLFVARPIPNVGDVHRGREGQAATAPARGAREAGAPAAALKTLLRRAVTLGRSAFKARPMVWKAFRAVEDVTLTLVMILLMLLLSPIALARLSRGITSPRHGGFDGSEGKL